ncbi:MAG: hypothetical protein AB7S26_07870 [Sandaracinaceae bacterium]
MDELLKLLDVVKRELGAEDARAEIGGRAPDDPRVVHAKLGESWRVVVTFARPVADAGVKREKLERLLAPFDVARRIDPPDARVEKQLELDAELDALAERAGARAALVFDERSPVLWGCSAPRADGWDVFAMEDAHVLARALGEAGFDAAQCIHDGMPEDEDLAARGFDETEARRWSHRAHRLHQIAPQWTKAEWTEAVQIATAVHAARASCKGGMAPERFTEHHEGYGIFARGFAQIYLLALVYDGPYSELHAEGPLLRALPYIEGLVVALPPVEPPPRGAKVIALRRP